MVDSMGHQRVENLVDMLADLWADKTAASLVVSSVVLKADWLVRQKAAPTVVRMVD